MALFESYERREPQILAVLKEYGINSIEECKDITMAAGIDVVVVTHGGKLKEMSQQNGNLMMEIGADQAEDVAGLIEETGKYVETQIKKDLAGLDRVVITKVQ